MSKDEPVTTAVLHDRWSRQDACAYIAWGGCNTATEDQRRYMANPDFRRSGLVTFTLPTFPRTIREAAAAVYKTDPPSEAIKAAERAYADAARDLDNSLIRGELRAMGRPEDDTTATLETIPSEVWLTAAVDARDPGHIIAGRREWFGVHLSPSSVMERWPLCTRPSGRAFEYPSGDTEEDALPLEYAWRLAATPEALAYIDARFTDAATTALGELTTPDGIGAKPMPATLSAPARAHRDAVLRERYRTIIELQRRALGMLRSGELLSACTGAMGAALPGPIERATWRGLTVPNLPRNTAVADDGATYRNVTVWRNETSGTQQPHAGSASSSSTDPDAGNGSGHHAHQNVDLTGLSVRTAGNPGGGRDDDAILAILAEWPRGEPVNKSEIARQVGGERASEGRLQSLRRRINVLMKRSLEA
ncbi:hypothetical protein [Azospirillum sp.]|uniref:hypothetical protein n=1 Tax=Azospirillum sp. TaxID=34012 RepID=UPI003D750CB9